MDQFQKELQEAYRAAQTGEVPQPDPNSSYGKFDFTSDNQEQANQPMGGQKPPGLEQFSHEEIMKMYKEIAKGNVPEELKGVYQETYNDKDGNPIIDKEGGATIQPNAGFVVKTQDDQGGKVFVNMTHHELVEGFSQKKIPKEDQAKFETDEGLRVPLSLGSVREDRDKKGDPVQVYDFIWNTETVKKAQRDPGFRQVVVELAFNYIKQRFDRDLDFRFTIPKMKYKGDTIQYQRIKAKKAPKISEVEMTDEERARMEQQAFEEQKRREALREKEPKWKLYNILSKNLNRDMAKQEFLTKLIKDAYENDFQGDDQDRWNHLLENFEMKEQMDVFEEYDGLNQEDAEGVLMVVYFPLLTRGHAIQCHVLSDEYIQIQVPNIYYLALGLPIKVDQSTTKCFFDCKLRRLFVHIDRKIEEVPEPIEVSAPVEEEEKPEENLEEDIIEIDTDEHFGRGNTGKK